MASTAISTLPQAVMTTTGSVESVAWRRGQQVEPFLAGGGVAGVVEVHQGGVELRLLDGRDHGLGRGGELELIALGFEQKPQGFQHVLLVIGDQDAVASFFHGSLRGYRLRREDRRIAGAQRASVHSVM